MGCPHLRTAATSICNAARGEYHPSAEDRKVLCNSGNHRACPLYCNVERDGAFDLTKLDLWTFDHAA